MGYTYFQCPCTDTSTPTRRLGEDSPIPAEENSEDDDRTFDPRAPRANYSLYPLEHLLYCEDCHQIRCPRCVLDEIVTWYCPNCLFEVPSSTVKTEGNSDQMHAQLFSMPDMHRSSIRQQRRSTTRRPWGRIRFSEWPVRPQLRVLHMELQGDRHTV